MPKQNNPSGTVPDKSDDDKAPARRNEEAGANSGPRRIGRRKSQYLVASRQAEELMPMGLMPLSSNVVEQALRSSPDIEIVDIIKPKAAIGAFGAAGGNDTSSIMVARMADEKAGVLHQQGQGRLIVEQDQSLHLLDPALSVPGLVSGFVAQGGTPIQVGIIVTGSDGRPVPGAEVYLFGSLLPSSATTDEQGRAVLMLYGETPDSITALYVKPRADHWSFYQRNPDIDFDTPNLVGLRPLAEWPALSMFPQQQTWGWGQRAMRLDRLPPQYRGQGIKIAIIDSGAAITHEDLQALHLGVDIVNKKTTPETWTQDLIAHGSHCAGVIAGRDGPHGVRGFAPDAEIHVCKLFPGGQVSQLIDALEYCIEQQVDVVNLSLGGAQPSAALEQQLLRARRQGIACIVAAGNSGNEVQYPASSPHVLAVAAIGKLGEFPPDSYHTETVGSGIDGDGYFSAKFSCYGPQIALCAPGVAIASCVPSNNFAVWDGTSMAAPHVTGLAALVLAHHPDFKQRFAARGTERVERLFQILKYSARPINIGNVQRTGYGMPDVLVALGLQPPLIDRLGASQAATALANMMSQASQGENLPMSPASLQLGAGNAFGPASWSGGSAASAPGMLNLMQNLGSFAGQPQNSMPGMEGLGALLWRSPPPAWLVNLAAGRRPW